MTHRSLLGCLAVAYASTAHGEAGSRARFLVPIQPQALRLQITEVALGAYAEGSYHETTLDSSHQTSRYQRYFIGPDLTLGLQGSIYHPNFILFHFLGNVAYGYSDQQTQSGGRTDSSQDMQILGNFRFAADIFPNKPLHGTLYSDYGRSYREYDFFTQVTTEILNYGTRLAYTDRQLQLNLTYAHSTESVSDTTAPYDSDQDTVYFSLHHDRVNSDTTLDYTYTHYDRPDIGAEGQTSSHTLNLADTEQFGHRNQYRWNSSTSYDHRETTANTEDQFGIGTGLTIEHTPRLSTSYDTSYSRFESTGFTSQSYGGQAGLRHQLYESLTTSLSANASRSESDARDTHGDTTSYGGGITESYTKRLTDQHRLALDASYTISHVDSHSSGVAINEQHTFPKPPDSESFFLNLPNVDTTTIIVADTTTLLPYTPGLDYDILVNGSRTEIRRLIGGTIPEGATVRVDYSAQPTPAGDYESDSELAGIRFLLFNGTWILYARVNRTGNNAPADLHVPELIAYTAGSYFTWHWLRAAAEYQRYDSTESEYQTIRFNQNASWRLTPVSATSLGLSQSYTDYISSHRHSSDYRLTAGYHHGLNSHLRADANAGLAYRQGTGDQLIAMARPELSYTYGRTSLQLRYNYEYSLYFNSEERHKHTFSLRLRREF